MTETPQAQPQPAQVLAELIDAYATAKASGNETLLRISVGPLQEFLNAHMIVPKPNEAVTEIAEEAEE